MKITKDKINIRSKLAELLNFNQTLEQLKQNGVGVGKNTNSNHNQLQVEGNTQSDSISLSELSTKLGDANSIVDAFVYDTTQDTDGGAWRARTTHTSWYNEPLNTPTRGSRREFPSVVVIVSEEGKLTIYDADDADLSMWMVFDVNNDVWLKHSDDNIIASIEMLNAKLVTCGYRLSVIDFISDSGYVSEGGNTGDYCYEHNDISRRNIDGVGHGGSTGNIFITNIHTNDVAMTVLPGAPVDPQTGLATPTIAVATDYGVSVIKYDGTVVDIAPDSTVNSTGIAGTVDFYADDRLVVGWDTVGDTVRHAYTYRIPTQNTTASGSFVMTGFGDVTTQTAGNSDLPFSSTGSSARYGAAAAGDDVVFGRLGGDTGFTRASQNESDPKSGMVCMINSTRNTGWMVGDTKLAALSDTTTETLGVDESQLVTNGTFTSNTDGWQAAGDATISVNDNQLVLQTGTNGSSLWAYQTISLQPGDYEFSVDVVENAANRALVRVGSTGPNSSDLIGSSTQSGTSTFVAGFSITTARDVTITLMYDTQSASNRWDNVSLTRKGNLVINGDFAGGESGWTAQLGVVSATISVTNNKLTVNATGNYGGVNVDAGYLPQLTPGETYTMTVDIDSISNGGVRFGIISGFSSSDFTTPGVHTGTFVFPVGANLSDIFIDNSNSGASTFIINSVSLRLAESEHSVYSNGLQVHGTIDKKQVAAGADLVAYSGFSEESYLVQPYNSDLDFGTNTFYGMTWAKMSNTQSQFILDRGDGGLHPWPRWDGSYSHNPPNRFMFYMNNDVLEFYTNYRTGVSTLQVQTGVWHHLVWIYYQDGSVGFAVDGVYEHVQGLGPRQTIDNITLNPVVIGGRHSNPISGVDGHPLQGQLSLLRVGAGAPTAAQIEKIYQDERPMFNAGAKCTLYGDDDYTWCTAHNKHNGLLHVGTESGRSDFQGLIRVDQQNTPVTKFISTGAEFTIQQ